MSYTLKHNLLIAAFMLISGFLCKKQNQTTILSLRHTRRSCQCALKFTTIIRYV